MKAPLNGQNHGKTNGQNNRSIMFGFNKRKSPDEVSKFILERIYGALAHPRQHNNGVLPDSIIESKYVIGFHIALITNLNIVFNGGRHNKHPEDLGFVYLKVLSEVFGLNSTEVTQRVWTHTENPSQEFNKGYDDGEEAFLKINNDDDASNAFIKFMTNIQHLYQ